MDKNANLVPGEGTSGDIPAPLLLRYWDGSGWREVPVSNLVASVSRQVADLAKRMDALERKIDLLLQRKVD